KLLEVQIDFRRPAAGGQSAVACIRLNRSTSRAAENGCGQLSLTGLNAMVQCEKGTAWLEGVDQVVWESGGQQKSESVASDRPGVEVMLDQFARRAVGGLLPVPTLEDLFRAYRHVEAALASRSG